jgi:tetratricopeptide (TPR) repeat protein
MACRQAWPDAAAGWLLGSIAALLADEKESALALAELWLARHPDDVRCLLQRAECLFALGRRADALNAAQTAAARPPVQPADLDGIGQFLVHAGEHAAALPMFDRAIMAAPNEPDLLAKRAFVHRYLGAFDKAAADHEAVLALLPGDPDALKGLADLTRQTDDRNRLETMREALSRLPADSHDAATLNFALAKSLDDLERHDESWSHLAAGNRIERGRFQYDASTDRAALTRIAAAFPNAETVLPDTTGERPVFICGLPRTGTTMVERIIGNHSALHSAGELSALSEAIAAAVARSEGPRPRDWLDYGSFLGRVDPAYVARRYLELAQTRRGDRPRFSDKQPMNFLYCPLIFRAFPQARIIHLTRHPLATCYAIFKTRFVGTYPFAYDLRELGEFYVGYHQLMRHWHEILPGRILDIAYEDVVRAIEPTTRRMLDYLDLPFEPACLNFHLNPSPTSTASAVQVRRPLYDSSLHHWRRYAAQLAPLRDQLATAGIAVN